MLGHKSKLTKDSSFVTTPKVEYITSSHKSNRMLLLWTAKLPFPMKNNPKQQPPANNQHDLQVGLKTLVHLEAKPLPPHPSIVHNHSLATTSSKPSSPPPPPQPSSSSFISLMCDLIGTGSGVCMSSDIDEELKEKPQMTQSNRSSSSKARRYQSAMTRQYPPSIPLLARTGNLRGRMPWVFERDYSSDGRLIITAERVKHHEYFEIYRENGRLNMTLVPVDINTVYFDAEGEELEELVAEEEEGGGGFDNEEEFAKEGSNLWQKSSLENKVEPCGDHVSSGLIMLVGGLGFGPVLESQGNLGCERLLGPDWLGSSSAHDYPDMTLPYAGHW